MFLVRSTPATPGAPGTPSQTISAPAQGTLRVVPSGTAPAGWKTWLIEIGDAVGGPFTVVQTAWPANQAYDHTGLAASTTKFFRVQGTTNDGQVSAYSTATSGTTLAAPVTGYAPGFPRLAVVPISEPFEDYDNTATINLLAKFHICVWNHYNGMQAGQGLTMSLRDCMAARKAAKPGSMSTAPLDFIYVNPGEFFNDQPGERRRVKLDSQGWWLYPSGVGGTPVVSTWAPNLWTTNPTRYVPRDGNGDSMVEWWAKLDIQQNITGEPGNAPNDQADGFFVDVCFWKPRVDGDWDRNGSSDSQDNPTYQFDLRQGFVDYFTAVRANWTGIKYLLGNTADWPQAGTATSAVAPFDQALEGGISEGFIGESWSVLNWGGVAGFVQWYRFNEDALKAPKLNIVGAKLSSSTAYQEARKALAAILIVGDGYAQLYTGYGPNETMYFDEYDNAGTGMEYLGTATDARQTAANENGVWRRRFSGGVAYWNPGGSPANVTAYRALKRINGTQAPSVNSGATIANGATISIPANDGLILLNN